MKFQQKTISIQPGVISCRLISSIPLFSSGESTGANVQNNAANSVPAKFAKEHDSPTCAQASTELPGGELGHDRQHGGNCRLGEELLARQHGHQEAERITEADNERPPWRIEQMGEQDGLLASSEKLIDRPAATPDHHSETAGRAISSSPRRRTDFVDDRRARRRSSLDVLGFAFGPSLLLRHGRSRSIMAGEIVAERQRKHQDDQGDPVATNARQHGRVPQIGASPEPVAVVISRLRIGFHNAYLNVEWKPSSVRLCTDTLVFFKGAGGNSKRDQDGWKGASNCKFP